MNVKQQQISHFNAALSWRGVDAVYSGFGFETPIRVMVFENQTIEDADSFELDSTETYALCSPQNLPEFNKRDRLIVNDAKEYRIASVVTLVEGVKVKIGLE